MPQPLHEALGLKLGRRAPKFTLRTMRLSQEMALALAPLGAAPERCVDYVSAVKVPWGMYGNDRLGDCLTDGTIVDAQATEAGFKVPYSGPIISITTATGKRLSVTANHQMLTQRGWVSAKFIQQGDHLIGARGSQPFPWSAIGGGKTHINQPPTSVEEIVAALRLRVGTVREVMPVPIDLHGDGLFVKSDVEVVWADSLLRSEDRSALGKPHRKDEIGPAGKLKRSLHGLGASFKRLSGSWAATLGGIGISGYGAAFALSHAGVAQPQGLSLASNWDTSFTNGSLEKASRYLECSAYFCHRGASGVHPDCFRNVPVALGDRLLEGELGDALVAGRVDPSPDGGGRDPKFASDVLQRLTGLVELDRVLHVEVQHFEGHVYEISTPRHWYLANGIVTHNCVCADTAHVLMLRTAVEGSIVVPEEADVIKLYEAVGGYVPGDPSTDRGCNESDMCEYLIKTGFLGHLDDATAMIDPKNEDHVKWTVQLFGSCRIGIPVYAYMMTAFAAGKPWDVAKPGDDQTLEGGHDVPIVDYGDGTYRCVTWGRIQEITPAFMTSLCEEAHASLSFDWARARGAAPNGLNLAGLEFRLRQVEATS